MVGRLSLAARVSSASRDPVLLRVDQHGARDHPVEIVRIDGDAQHHAARPFAHLYRLATCFWHLQQVPL